MVENGIVRQPDFALNYINEDQLKHRVTLKKGGKKDAHRRNKTEQFIVAPEEGIMPPVFKEKGQ
jgi:hypothetical protein